MTVTPSVPRSPHRARGIRWHASRLAIAAAVTASLGIVIGSCARVELPVERPTVESGHYPTTTTTSMPTTTPTPSTAWRGAGLVELPGTCADMRSLGLSWYYNWSADPICRAPGVPFVPMVWGDWCSGIRDCTTLPAHVAAAGVQAILGFNEPDSDTQSNVTVDRALQLWPYLETTGLRLGSPAVRDNAEGRAWLDAFMAGADARHLRVDFVAVHWYGDCNSPQGITDYLASMTRYGRPLWLTEFACYRDSSSTNTRFMQQVVPTLAALPYLERIAWFTNRSFRDGYEYTALIGANGALTPVGHSYAVIPPCIGIGQRKLIECS
jgi:hypothetical protein